MRTRLGSEVINEDRRQLLSTAAMGIAEEERYTERLEAASRD